MAYKDKTKAVQMQNKWISEAYDRINLTVPKGQKASIKAHAQSMGESVNAFIGRAINNQISQDLNKANEN